MEESKSESFGLKVSRWSLPDVRQHIFLLVWVCSVPVHLRYVVQLLRASAVPSVLTVKSKKDCVPETSVEPESKKGCVITDNELRSIAVDVLFTQVGADCCAANASVSCLCSSGEHWSEPRSLILSAEDGALGDTWITAQNATAAGEVLALLPSGDVAQRELQLAYFTALDHAQKFEEQQACFPGPVCVAPCAQTEVILIDSDDGGSRDEAKVIVVDESSGSGRDTPVRKRARSSVVTYEVVD
ncbi:hypothetical protein ERJ75_001670100 [Trypanosoma vivax]|nr:hypothetical protein TRVL_00464 [Trypanosoma vivax]KAH8605075.1 hypothetical protein ERJ75_001670100 [Trypanosoma vivax]